MKSLLAPALALGAVPSASAPGPAWSLCPHFCTPPATSSRETASCHTLQKWKSNFLKEHRSFVCILHETQNSTFPEKSVGMIQACWGQGGFRSIGEQRRCNAVEEAGTCGVGSAQGTMHQLPLLHRLGHPSSFCPGDPHSAPCTPNPRALLGALRGVCATGTPTNPGKTAVILPEMAAAAMPQCWSPAQVWGKTMGADRAGSWLCPQSRAWLLQASLFICSTTA